MIITQPSNLLRITFLPDSLNTRTILLLGILTRCSRQDTVAEPHRPPNEQHSGKHKR